MKHRWMGRLAPLLLVAMVALGGCAPARTGGDADASEEPAPAHASPSTDADEPSSAPADNPGSDDYGY